MFKKDLINLSVFVLLLLTIGMIGCGDEKPSEPAPFPTNAEVFIDEFGNSVTFQAFAGSKLDAVQIDAIETYQGSQSLIITVPDVGDPNGSFAGGAFTADIARDLTEFNALTFWAKASTEATLDVAGIGNDNTGTSKYTAEINNLPLTTAWTKYIIPIPLSSKLEAEQGLFYFAEGPENSVGNTIWFDEIQFESLNTITNATPVIVTQTIDIELNEEVKIDNSTVTFLVDGNAQIVEAMMGYFTFTSSDTSIVSVDSDGVITGIAVGTATLTATLGTGSAAGTVTVQVGTPLDVPTTPAPIPTVDAADVISLYSDAYTDEVVDLWSTDWDITDLADEMIGSDNVKKYYNLTYAGIEFNNPPIDASSMTRFHIDVWTPNNTDAPAVFKIKLVDFGPNGVYDGGGDDAEHELTFDESIMNTGSWVSIDVPLASFTGLTTKGHLAQMIISGDLSTVYVDNIYFYDAGLQIDPLVSAPTPTEDAGSVISLFSDAYNDVTIDRWSTSWDVADVEDYTVGSDNMKKYSNLSFAAIEFTSVTIDASAMTHFHIDIWTPDASASSSAFKVKLVDLGADGVFGGSDDVDHEIPFSSHIVSPGIWVSLDIPLWNFTGLITKGHLGQLIISGDIQTVFVDNIYLYDSGVPTTPAVSAPTPTVPAADVISLFSDAYTDMPVNTWSTVWDSADVDDYVIGSDVIKKYTNLLFVGIEFVSPTIDITSMTHFHMDIWTPDATSSITTFKIKLVDFGANGGWDGGGDDVEHEITLDGNLMKTSSWISIEIPMTDFIGLTTREHLAQLILVADPNTVFIDNVYFHK